MTLPWKLALAGFLITVLLPATVRPQPAPNAETITVRLSNFEFNPENLRVRVGVPVRLQLVNDSSGGHDFSAPAFFAASAFVSGSQPHDGAIDVPAKASVDVVVIPRTAGTYKVECTHFLHSLFGMTGTITVAGS